jgi:hypothetical protein
MPDYIVDDYPEMLQAFRGSLIRSVDEMTGPDREMWRVYEEIKGFAATR